MRRRIASPAIAVFVAAALSAAVVGTAVGSNSSESKAPPPGANAGPTYNFATEIMYDNVVPLKNEAILMKSKRGYIYRGGQQDNHLVVTRVAKGLRFVDSGTQSFKKLSHSCHRQKVNKGIAAVCRVPATVSVRKPVLIEVWPRLGDDYLDTSDLPATFGATELGDKGNDTARFGAGRDYFNGYSGRDQIFGGAGNDWIRAGLGNDKASGGPDNDDIVSVEGRDTVLGGSGKDRLWAGDGDDRLSSGSGQDFLLCGSGHDSASADSADDVLPDCESIN